MASTTITRPDQTPTAAAEVLADFCIELAVGTPVLTLQGELPVEHLLPGDRLITRAGAMPVTAVSSRLATDEALLRVSARALGHDRPAEDVLLAEGQPVLIRDWRSKALFGASEAVVPLSRLIDGSHIRREAQSPVRMIRLDLPRAAVIYAGGLELAATPATVVA